MLEGTFQSHVHDISDCMQLHALAFNIESYIKWGSNSERT